MREIPIPEHIVPFDPAMIRVCGGVAAAVLFSWFEHLFNSPIPRPVTIAKPYAEWVRLSGMRRQYFCRTFNKVCVVHQSSRLYQLARISGREFWSPHYERHLFYSAEITGDGKDTILRRNAFDIELALTGKVGQSRETSLMGAKSLATSDARRFLKKLSE